MLAIMKPTKGAIFPEGIVCPLGRVENQEQRIRPEK
jgi:hypothetical protein